MSVGTYVDLTGARLRLYGPNPQSTTNDTLLTAYCSEVNDTIEKFTGRVLAPVPTFSTTFSGTAGTNTITLASATGLGIGDDLLLGLLSGSHESGNVMAISGTTVKLRQNLANTYAPGTACQRIYVQDGFGALGYDNYPGGNYLPFGQVGIVNLAALEVATTTPPTSPFAQIPQSDYFLRPTPPDPGWPYVAVEMTNIPSPGNSTPIFYPGFANIRLIGPGPCAGLADATGFGFPAIPDEIVAIAYNMLAGRWQARQSGGTYQIEPGSGGVQVGGFFLSAFDYGRLSAYKYKTVSVIE